jgi:hypothetical protein
MARPKFSVHHFLACLNIRWEGVPPPLPPITLEGVSYIYRVPPGTESPEFEEFWLYARLFLTNGVDGSRKFSIEVVGPNQRVVVSQPVGEVRFSIARPVVNVSWPIRPIQFVVQGQYEFRLLCEEQTWRGPRNKLVATEYIRIAEGR